MELKAYRVSHKVTVEYVRYVLTASAREDEIRAQDMGDTEGDFDAVTMTNWKATTLDGRSAGAALAHRLDGPR